MSEAATNPLPTSPLRPAPKVAKKLLPNGLMGMFIFITTEVMFFAALISAHMIVKSGADAWPPADQPRLPVVATAINSLFLLLSGIMVFRANLAMTDKNMAATKRLTAFALGLAAVFVGIQGFEWVNMLNFGLTITSSTYGAFFYLIIGTHALHAIGALLLLGYDYLKLHKGTLTQESFWTTQAFWYFVVGVWPVLYVIVYLM